ncbi:hypothetical protein J5J86_16850 [Aquabacter sp. L1I39]|uniref:hypothetical protein n=1 Tax=Aquabacter sp. L1I39 TaxID=2820278 RepID=UPI001ADA79BF|nr:hypothetical protein [Aquabacter sp. L1I39]QTL02452.1 hypothetical protein J5J86_16850 [Aquabacter sp. L1I39]
MDQQAAVETNQESNAGARSPVVRVSLALAWLVFGLLVLALLLPPRFSATARFGFDVAAQPPAASVNGVVQLLQSRELAGEALGHMTDRDVATLARARFPKWMSRLMGDAADWTEKDRAAAILASSLRVTPINGGRAIALTVSAARPALAARAAGAYATAYANLDASVRDRSGNAAAVGAAPILRLEKPPEASNVPDPPTPARLAALALLFIGIGLLTVSLGRRTRPRGPVSPRSLPRESIAPPRVSWIEAGSTGGLGTVEAANLLARRLTAMAEAGPARSRLVVVTSEQPVDRSAPVAVALARRLSEGESRVALVALDGDSGDLAALVSDPWAPGMSEMLFGVAGFGETIHRDTQSRAHVIPPGRHARGGVGVVKAERLSLILKALCQTYDFVVVAAPAFAGAGGAGQLAALDPLIVCIEEDSARGGGIDTFEALAGRGFRNVVMLRLSVPDGVESSPVPDSLPVPSLTATAA